MKPYDLITQPVVFLSRNRYGKRADTYTGTPVMGSFDRQTTNTVGSDGRITTKEKVRICIPVNQDKWHAIGSSGLNVGDYAYQGKVARGLGFTAEEAMDEVEKNNGVKITHVRKLDYDAVGGVGLGKYGSIYYCEGE